MAGTRAEIFKVGAVPAFGYLTSGLKKSGELVLDLSIYFELFRILARVVVFQAHLAKI